MKKPAPTINIPEIEILLKEWLETIPDEPETKDSGNVSDRDDAETYVLTGRWSCMSFIDWLKHKT